MGRRQNKPEEPQEPKPGIDFRLIGYARVSTAEQNLAMQLEALRNAGVMETNLYTDKASGKTLNRKGLQEALLDARPGDQFVVWKLDRLARSILDTLYLAKRFKDEGIHLRSLTESIDTTTPMGAFVLHIFAALAEMESAQTGFRTKRGMATAARMGRKFGPEAKFGKKHFPAAIKLLKSGISAEAVGKEFGVSGQVIRTKILAATGKKLWKPKVKKPKGKVRR
jgi:DNA invertase Pin-like site-specific DNA recombinase